VRRAPLIAWLVLPLALAGCGFHLQGTAHLPAAFAVTQIDAEDRYTDFNRALSLALRTSGSRVVGRGEEAGAAVEVLKDDSGQTLLSVSPQTNTPTEYNVYYTVRYRVRVAGREVIPAQTLTLTRDYPYDPTAALAKEHEQDVIREALARDIAALVMRRLAAVTP
jgi:LPS-assembly lipoprotein